MHFRKFHNPNICIRVIRRRVIDELLQLFVTYIEMSATRAKSFAWNNSFPSRESYRMAVYRLRRAGLIAYRRSSDNEGVISIMPDAKARMPEVYKPEKFWKTKWKGVWYVMVYDVPEKNRRYRDTLREFLFRMRMGCLQKSVWVTTRDIRPEYDDMARAAAISQYAFLFQAQTVLGQRPMEIVEAAWDFDRLEEVQLWYCEVYGDNLGRVLSGKLTRQGLEYLAREEMSAYLSVMEGDPLLPEELLPRRYHGMSVYALHKKMIKAIGKRL